MGVLAGFLSTWSGARAAFGEGAPQGGEPYDASASLQDLQAQVGAAAPAHHWSGGAARAYGTVSADHGKVLGSLAGLDRRLREQIDRSAAAVTRGRTELDAVKQWVLAAARSVPPNDAGERMLVPIVAKGIGEVATIVTRSTSELTAIGAAVGAIAAEYRALGTGPKLGPAETPVDREAPTEPENEYERALRDAGLLTGPSPGGHYRDWLENAQRQRVPPETIVDIARRHQITPSSFDVLNDMEQVTDPDGKTFFLLPPGTNGEDARKAALMTYILNAGTDYGEGTAHDFPVTPYSADEVDRILDRQAANAWSYDTGVGFVDANGGRLMSTPNGILMGLGGNPVQDVFSEDGGSTYGDIFMANIDDPDDAAQSLRDMAGSGVMWYPQPDGNGARGELDLDRLLHHEEKHSTQWATLGPERFIAVYGAGQVASWMFGVPNPLEAGAGLGDGGYR
ncbi:MAG: EspA/EspE family type VII secretion system effector [Actinomycetota bacterium]|nr:EspA/EspE family type VII secretion system effector [Actinomycetota bacterium]